MEIPGQHHRHGHLHDLGRLNTHDNERDPAPRTIHHDPEQGHRHQQHHTQDIERHGIAHHGLRWCPGNRQHDGGRPQHVDDLPVQFPEPIAGCRRINARQANPAQDADDQQQWQVKMRQCFPPLCLNPFHARAPRPSRARRLRPRLIHLRRPGRSAAGRQDNNQTPGARWAPLTAHRIPRSPP